jgi:hypothetical protein
MLATNAQELFETTKQLQGEASTGHVIKVFPVVLTTLRLYPKLKDPRAARTAVIMTSGVYALTFAIGSVGREERGPI